MKSLRRRQSKEDRDEIGFPDSFSLEGLRKSFSVFCLLFLEKDRRFKVTTQLSGEGSLFGGRLDRSLRKVK